MTSQKRGKMTQNIPTTTFAHSLLLETRRVLYLAAKIPSSIYQSRGFLILPSRPDKAPNNIVVFPDLPFHQVRNFWERTHKLKITTPINAPESLITETSEIVRHAFKNGKYEKAQKSLLGSWNQIESKFWHNLFTLFPAYSTKVDSVNIYITQYGPISSFNVLRGSDKTIHIYLRLDATIDNLVWAILVNIFRGKMQDELKFTWSETEAVIDWLIQESSLNPNITKTKAVMTSLRKSQLASLTQKSREYLTKLGFAKTDNPWTKSGNSIYYSGTEIIGLTTRQQKLLEVLLAKRGQTVTYDELALVMWPNGEDFSLWAIVKEIARVRKCLKSAGINHPVLQSHRKLGYSLN